MLKSDEVEKLSSIPPTNPQDSHHTIDVMNLVNSIPITENINNFGDFRNTFCLKCMPCQANVLMYCVTAIILNHHRRKEQEITDQRKHPSPQKSQRRK